MNKVKFIAAGLLLYGVFFLYVKAHSQSADIQMEVVHPAMPGETSKKISIDGMFDEGNGSAVMLMNACGNLLKFHIKTKPLRENPDAVTNELSRLIRQICVGGELTGR